MYFIACTPDMWKLAMLGPPLSVATVVFILASSLVAPPVYLVRIIFGEIVYLGALAPFAVIFTIGVVVVWLTERKRTKANTLKP